MITDDQSLLNHLSTRQPLSAATRELLLLVALVLGFFLLAMHVELSESLTRFTQHYEHWQLDELPLTLLLLSVGLCWFSVRRMREAQRELDERVRAQRKVAELHEQNRELSQRLIAIQEEERRALARELHDEVGQNCTAIRAEASYIMHAPANEQIGISAQRIAQAAQALSAMVRDILVRLRPPTLDSLGLESALQELCESWEQQSGIACALFRRDVPARIEDSTAIALFRLVQEALTNVSRHAQASQVRITLHPISDGKYLSLTIQDDGRGLPDADARCPGFGLIGMRERVASLRGSIHFFSAANCGLRIAVELPVTQS